MKRFAQICLPLMVTLVVLAGLGCKDRRNEPLEYDRSALVTNLSDAIIVPAYADLLTSLDSLKAHQVIFRAEPYVHRLNQLQLAFVDAWFKWKQCSAFEFGPAAGVSLRSALNTFPTDTTQIKLNVNAGTWDLNLASNTDARGFPALDFMLYGLGNDNYDILARYIAPADSAHMQAYLGALVADMHGLVAGVHNQWTSSYGQTFKASLGTDVGSSTSLLVNELNRDLEIIKTASIGIPLGKQTFDTPLPDKVEAPYSNNSVNLALVELGGLERLFLGHNRGGVDGYGMWSALDALEAQYNSAPLSQAIANQFIATEDAITVIPEPLSLSVVSNRATVEAAYNEIQKLVILLKTDMASAMSILITYTDADGD